MPRPDAAALSLPAARRIALAAQGLTRPRPVPVRDRRPLRGVFRAVGVVQLDSVNVLVRSHYLPAFSRLGPYPRELLDRVAYRDRLLFEYWAHEASLLPVELHPLLRWRMRRARETFVTWGRMARLAQDRPELLRRVLSEVRARGPLTPADLDHAQERPGSEWGWNWSDAKTALEYLFWTGEVTTAGRRNFQRSYDLAERVIPAAVLDLPTPPDAEAFRGLLLVAARSLGVATASDLLDYFRLKPADGRPALADLVASGELEPVRVHGWRAPAYLLPGTDVPRRTPGGVLLSPFDSAVWFRDRVERLFGVRYRLEIYVPPAQRRHGYYVLPFLSGDRLVARVDLKSDRRAGRLLVQAAHREPDADPGQTATALAAELARLAGWLGASDVAVADRGDLAPALRRAVSR